MLEYPLVSVVIATYNMGQYVTQAVDSILGQEYPFVEAIVVDDGSTDNTLEALSRYNDRDRVKIIHQNNAGQAAAKNRGLLEAGGKYIGFCDADNLWLPHKLKRQLPLFKDFNDQAVIYGDGMLIDADGKNLPNRQIERHSGWITGLLLIDNFVSFNTALVPKQIIDHVGGFDESFSMGIDYDLWLRISVNYPFFYLPEQLIKYRIWGGQMSTKMDERFANCFRIVNNFLKNHQGSVTKLEVRRGWAHTYVSRANWRAAQKEYQKALQDYIRAFTYKPNDLRLWKSIVKFMLGR